MKGNEKYPPCTAHFGGLVGDEPLLAVGWYRAGLVLIDFSSPEDPRLVGQWADRANAYDAKYHEGHVFTGDWNRGMAVLRVLDD